ATLPTVRAFGLLSIYYTSLPTLIFVHIGIPDRSAALRLRVRGAKTDRLEETMSFLSRDRTIAPPGYSRWLIPPAALCVHLCIGQAYAFSVFNLPMTKLLGITQSAPGDWALTDLGWIFSLGIFFLGVSAALLGRWVEEGGPRRAMFTAALCWGGGFLLSAIG